MTAAVRRQLRRKGGVLLDISFGGTPQARSLTFGPKGDLRADPRRVPFPLPDACVLQAVVTHVLEYLPPPHWFAWWDELWRVMKPLGIAYVSGPYGGDESLGWLSDPTHETRVVEASFAWLDPRIPFYQEHQAVGRAQPRPWHTQAVTRVPMPNQTIGYNAVLQKVAT
jgi:hypothetical protein